ncbi:MAG: hypothetical protein ACOYI4_08665 [Christensenellales bacterium]|jgi:hypothetical protein
MATKKTNVTEVEATEVKKRFAFNPLRDIAEVEDGLAVDITDMLETGVVKDSSATLENNKIDNPHNIVGIVRDEFAAIDAARLLRSYGKIRSEKKKRQEADAIKQATEVSAPAPSSPVPSASAGSTTQS